MEPIARSQEVEVEGLKTTVEGQISEAIDPRPSSLDSASTLPSKSPKSDFPLSPVVDESSNALAGSANLGEEASNSLPKPDKTENLTRGGGDAERGWSSGVRIYGKELVWGVREPKPITGAPSGRYRLRMRNRSIAVLFVRTPSSIRVFALLDNGDHWTPAYELEQGRSERWTQLNVSPEIEVFKEEGFRMSPVLASWRH
jgi:hypothetical protein